MYTTVARSSSSAVCRGESATTTRRSPCIVGSRERKVTTEFLRLKSHFLFEEHFCLVRRPNEKGHVERLLDFARRNFLVPVPRVAALEALNGQLVKHCRNDLARQPDKSTFSFFLFLRY
jgi:transposase